MTNGDKNRAKRKKQKEGIEFFKNDCMAIVSNSNSLETLFSNLDQILEYSLKAPFDRNNVAEQFRLLGGEEFARVLLFCLDNCDTIDIINFLQKLEIDQHLCDHIKFIVAKYGIKYSQLLSRNFNELSWINARHSIIKKSDNLFLLEFSIDLINGTSVTIRDDSDSMAELATHFVNALAKINSISPINKDLLVDLSGAVAELLKEE